MCVLGCDNFVCKLLEASSSIIFLASIKGSLVYTTIVSHLSEEKNCSVKNNLEGRTKVKLQGKIYSNTENSNQRLLTRKKR